MSDVFPYRPPLAMGSAGRRASGYWGAVFLILSETSIFAYLYFAYYYFSTQMRSGPWPPTGPPSFTWSAPQCVVMIIAALAAWFAQRSAARGERGRTQIGLAINIVFGCGFVALQFIDWYSKPFGLASNSYASFYFVMTGAHLAHVVAGIIITAAVLVWSLLHYLGPVRHTPVMVTTIYWYFLLAIWLTLFFTINCTPYLG